MAILIIFSLKTLMFLFLSLSLSTASEPECKASYGTGIDLYHCMEALGRWDLKHQDAPQKFSRNVQSGAMTHMPQSTTFSSCSIGIDLVDVHFGDSAFRHVVSTWANLKTEVRKLLHACVSPPPGRTPPTGAGQHHWNVGGKLVAGGFEFVIINPTSGVGMGTCLQPHKPLTMSLGNCVDSQAKFIDQQRAQANRSPPPRPIAPAAGRYRWQVPPPPFTRVEPAPGAHPHPGAYLSRGTDPNAPSAFAPYRPPVPGVRPIPVAGPVQSWPAVPGGNPSPQLSPLSPPYRPPVPGVHSFPGAPPPGYNPYRQPPPPRSKAPPRAVPPLRPQPPPPRSTPPSQSDPPSFLPPLSASGPASMPFDPLNIASGRRGRRSCPPSDTSDSASYKSCSPRTE